MAMVLSRLLTSSLVLGLFAVSAVGEVRYGADEHQSQWVVNSSKLLCSLSQKIPDYGEASFVRKAGGKLAFHMRVVNRPRDAGVAKVVSVAPAWNHLGENRELGQIKYTTGSTTFAYSEIMTRRLLLELQQGMYPTFSYQDWADGREQVQVALSSVNFHSSLTLFFDCLDKQFGYGFDYVRSSHLRFDFDSSKLGNTVTKRLDEIALYLKSDPSVHRVLLEGRTDNIGFRRYNTMLSKRRAEAVRDYLVAKGVAKSRIILSSKGEKQPLASNKTPQGRALNRSVDVTLSK